MKPSKKSKKSTYHHGNLAESLLSAVDEIASQFGLEAVTLRACAKRVGVSPSSAFRHYTDKRALLTAFAVRALHQLCDAMTDATADAPKSPGEPFTSVGLAYISFAIDKPAFFRAMWREEAIYSSDADYQSAANRLSEILKGGFAHSVHDVDPAKLDAEELLAWSSVHGLANLFVDGPVGNGQSRDEKLLIAKQMIDTLRPAIRPA
ncbi:MAG: TetR/AcrR family transcriptional regulator [Granulosicoccus sp.]